MDQNVNTAKTTSADVGDIDLSALLNPVWRAKYWIAFAALIFAAVGYYYVSFVAVPLYKSTSVVQLEANRQQFLDFAVALPGASGDTEEINTQVEVLRSRRLAERVVRAEGLLDDPEFNPWLRDPTLKQQIRWRVFGRPGEPDERKVVAQSVNNLLAGFRVRNVPNSYVLEVAVTTSHPEKSLALANRIAEEYVQYQIDVGLETTLDASAWLSNRVADLKLELESVEAELAAFSAGSALRGDESVQALEQQLKNTRERVDDAEADFVAEKARLSRLQAVAEASPEEIVAVAEDDVLATILETRDGAEAFAARWARVLAEAERSVERSEERINVLTARAASIETEMTLQSEELFELQHLQREAEASRLLYEHFLTRLKETSAQEGLRQARSHILSYGVLPTRPSEPNKSRTVALMAVLGIFLSAGMAILLETRQRTFRNASDIENFAGLPVFGQVPRVRARTRRSLLDYFKDNPTSAAAEAVRNLRTSVLMSNTANPPKIIMLTSALPGEGKTTMSMSLAHNMVGIGKKVLVVEGDLRRQVFQNYFQNPGGKGLLDVMFHDMPLEEAVVPAGEFAFDILFSGVSSTNSADILSAPEFAAFVETAREAYDLVIIDTPPVLVVPDARIVGQLVDMVLLALKWDNRTRNQLRDTLRQLETVNVPVGGMILNAVDQSRFKSYGYGDQMYGEYGRQYYNKS